MEKPKIEPNGPSWIITYANQTWAGTTIDYAQEMINKQQETLNLIRAQKEDIKTTQKTGYTTNQKESIETYDRTLYKAVETPGNELNWSQYNSYCFTAEQKEIIPLYIAGKTQAEIAEQLQITQQAVSKRMRVIKRQARKSMNSNDCLSVLFNNERKTLYIEPAQGCILGCMHYRDRDTTRTI